MTACEDILLCLTMSDKDAARLQVGDEATYTLKMDAL